MKPFTLRLLGLGPWRQENKPDSINPGYETDLWTVGRVRRVITEEFSIVLSKNTVWRRLRVAGLTYQEPVREYYEIDDAASLISAATTFPSFAYYAGLK